MFQLKKDYVIINKEYVKNYIRRLFCVPVPAKNKMEEFKDDNDKIINAVETDVNSIGQIMIDVTNDLKVEQGDMITIVICDQVKSNQNHIIRDLYLSTINSDFPIVEDYDYILTSTCFKGPKEKVNEDEKDKKILVQSRKIFDMNNLWLSGGGFQVRILHKSKLLEKENVTGNSFHILVVKKEPKHP